MKSEDFDIVFNPQFECDYEIHIFIRAPEGSLLLRWKGFLFGHVHLSSLTTQNANPLGSRPRVHRVHPRAVPKRGSMLGTF